MSWGDEVGDRDGPDRGDRRARGRGRPSARPRPPPRPTENDPRLDAIVFLAMDLGQVSGHRRRDVEGRGSGQHFHQPFPLPDALPSRREPVTHDDRYVRTGSQVGQDHGRQTHGEPRLVRFVRQYRSSRPPIRTPRSLRFQFISTDSGSPDRCRAVPERLRAASDRSPEPPESRSSVHRP